RPRRCLGITSWGRRSRPPVAAGPVTGGSRPQRVDDRRRTTPLRWFTNDHTLCATMDGKGTNVRRGPIAVLIGIRPGRLALLLAVAVNVAPGGALPGPLGRVAWVAWPSVALLAVIGIALAIWQRRLASADPSTVDAAAYRALSTVDAQVFRRVGAHP